MCEETHNKVKKDIKKPTYKYIEADSIIYGLSDDYAFTINEYFCIYSFFVTYSLCAKQSSKKRRIEDYGWQAEEGKKTTIVTSRLKDALSTALDLDSDPFFIFTEDNDLKARFAEVNLKDGKPTDISTERAVIGKTSGSNPYFKLFYRIRNALAHGKFILKNAPSGEQIILMQDNDNANVTARIILKKSTLLSFIRITDGKRRCFIGQLSGQI